MGYQVQVLRTPIVPQIGGVFYEAVYGGEVFKWSPLRRIARLYIFRRQHGRARVRPDRMDREGTLRVLGALLAGSHNDV